jgi:hypothetical protein
MASPIADLIRSTCSRSIPISCIWDRMVSTELDKAFVQGMGDEITVVRAWFERPVEERFHF